MPCTIHQLLANHRLALTLLTPTADTSRQVTWAHTSELVDPTPWLEGGELLMTLGLVLPKDRAGQEAYVARLAQAGVAGLGFDTGLVLEHVPEALVAAGTRHGLPVLRIPRDTPFVAISHAVISAIMADSLAAVTEVSRRQDRIAAAAVKSGAAGIVRTLAPLLGCDVVVMTTGGAALESAGTGAARLRDRVAERFAVRGRRAEAALTFTHVDDEGVITARSLAVDLEAPMVLATGSHVALTTHERLVVGHAASLLSLVLRTPDRVRRVETRLRRAAGQALLSGTVAPDPEMLELLGLRPEEPYVVAVFQAGRSHREVGPFVERLLLARRAPYLAGDTSRGLAVVLPAPGAAELILQIRRALDAHLARGVVAGLSEPVVLDRLGEGVAQASAAARAAANQHTEVTAYRELGPLDIFLRTQPRDVLETMSASLLGPLDEYDARHGTDLVGTLAAYLDHNGHAEATARALGIHRHTLRQRLRRIGGAVDRDLADPRLRTDAWVALQARAHLAAAPGRFRG